MAAFFRNLIECITKDEVTRFAASLSFYMALSFAPILVLFVVVSSTFTLHLQEELQREISYLVGQDGAELMRMVISSSKAHPDFSTKAGIIGSITLLISASLIFGELQDAMNRIFGGPNSAHETLSFFRHAFAYLKQRFIHIGIVLSFLLILIVSLVVSSLLYNIVLPTERTFTFLVNLVLSMMFYGSVFTLMIRFLPFNRQPWLGATKGGLITALMFLIGKEFIGAYIGNSAIRSVYGAAGSLIALLVWVYYSSIIILVGAEFTKLLINRKRTDPSRNMPSWTTHFRLR